MIYSVDGDDKINILRIVDQMQSLDLVLLEPFSVSEYETFDSNGISTM